MMKPRDMNFYIDRAKVNSGCDSDRKLAKLIGLGSNALPNYRKGKTLPSDETMETICRIARVDAGIGLLDLSSWRTVGRAKKEYENLLSWACKRIDEELQKEGFTKIKSFIFILVTVAIVGASPARAATISGPSLDIEPKVKMSQLCEDTVYYGKKDIIFLYLIVDTYRRFDYRMVRLIKNSITKTGFERRREKSRATGELGL